MSIVLSSNARETICSRFGDRVLFDEPLAPYVAYRIGGPADLLVFPRGEEELVWLSDFAQREKLPVTVVGTGTNLLVHDDGIRGVTVILKEGLNSIEEIGRDDRGVSVRVGGGVQKAVFLNWACERGYTGLEFSSGVPGTIGGGIFMNAGTKYGSYGDILGELRLFSFEKGVTTLRREELQFGYREQNAVRNAIVLSATFRLGFGESTVISAEINRIIAERAAKQPLDFPSCGSTFKNPPDLSAGRLIEKSGVKGLRIGDAEISEKHANFILNRGRAKASEVQCLIDVVGVIVEERFGVTLETEVIILGGPRER
ncbi:MAG: UDP-N-acetylmuramate dehydrogenase [Deltaproteobacteria bacterium]|nr:UDP-N-acetylmuramate dehydrogenase [Deltaproteobacteria bacterium]MBI3295980.1 UDP-N-acetylmuramate dehydrogenase [Deltaproteobacteria bacterium]